MHAQRHQLADVFRLHGQAYLQAHPAAVTPAQRRALGDIADCRTPALGGHLQRCDSCGHAQPLYNSCRNRNCPRCQALARARWLQARKAELLPVEYYHVVFTVPAPVAELAYHNRPHLYDTLFHAVRDTLVRIGHDPRHLGAQVGVLAILHTWGQNLHHHPHVHCVVPAGGLSRDGTRWIPSRRKGFLFPVRVLSALFRGILLDHIRRAHARDTLRFNGSVARLADHHAFDRWLDEQYRRDWVVYAKKPFAGPEKVLEYLARYTHRTAIANSRIVHVDQQRVTFKWRDYRRGSHVREMSLEPHEFIRRFLVHVLPRRTVRIRYFGFLANRHRAARLEQCRKAIARDNDDPSVFLPAPTDHDWKQLYSLLVGREHDRCPACDTGRMHPVQAIPRQRAIPATTDGPARPLDSS